MDFGCRTFTQQNPLIISELGQTNWKILASNMALKHEFSQMDKTP